MAEWWIRRDENLTGPVEGRLIVDALHAGKVLASDEACLVGSGTWVPVTAIPEVVAARQGSETSSAPTAGLSPLAPIATEDQEDLPKVADARNEGATGTAFPRGRIERHALRASRILTISSGAFWFVIFLLHSLHFIESPGGAAAAFSWWSGLIVALHGWTVRGLYSRKESVLPWALVTHGASCLLCLVHLIIEPVQFAPLFMAAALIHLLAGISTRHVHRESTQPKMIGKVPRWLWLTAGAFSVFFGVVMLITVGGFIVDTSSERACEAACAHRVRLINLDGRSCTGDACAQPDAVAKRICVLYECPTWSA